MSVDTRLCQDNDDCIHSVTPSQLCNAPQFAISDPPEMFALRDSKNDELVTESNLHRKIDNQTSFKLVASPMVEAIENVEKLQSGDQSSKKQATFSLRTHIKVGGAFRYMS